MVTPPYRVVGPFESADFRELRRRMMFDYFKWDPQVGDACTIGSFAVALRPEIWRELTAAAEALAAEMEAAETELLDRPELHRNLGLPTPIRKLLRNSAAGSPSPAAARVIRFDFHFTPEGWRISEANSDVPGGFNEAEGLARWVAERYPGLAPCGDPGDALAREVAAGLDPAAGVVALVHATAYTDDRQVMLHLARSLEALGYRPALAAPDQIRIDSGKLRIVRASPSCPDSNEPVLAALRFFPGEWLIHLNRTGDWAFWFRGSPVGLCNPGRALLSQTKRFPLVWDRLKTPMSAWRRYLPPTKDPREVSAGADEWILKPAWGRVGEGIGMPGVTAPDILRKQRRVVRRDPSAWVIQKRFEAIPLDVAGDPWTLCLGVYTVQGRAAGAYGRAARSPLIASTACDVAVLVETEERTNGEVPHAP
ncbi:MAG: glutathionylspermidine synthase family protein [Kiritimatiellia bacterium]|nr:glutathionylspermidine synthase family protein [Kiritimatiellia bacterium]